MSPLTASLIGILLGGCVLFYFSKLLEQKHHKEDLRALAYLDYLHGISEHAYIGYSRQSSEMRLLNLRISDAKNRICLYGSPAVINECAKFERLGAIINTDEQCMAYLKLIAAMRKDTMHQGIKSDSLDAIMLGKNAGSH